MAGPINELIDPTFNGSGLLNVVIACSGAEFRVREFLAGISGIPVSSYPELIDYSLILKNEDNTQTSVREFDPAIWGLATIETYMGMPEQYRGFFNDLRGLSNSSFVPSASGFIDLIYVSGTLADIGVVQDIPSTLYSKLDVTAFKKKFIGGMNLIAGSGGIPEFNFIGGSGATSLLYDATYNGSALPELIEAFATVTPSGLEAVIANPSTDIDFGSFPSDFSVEDPDNFGWLSQYSPIMQFAGSFSSGVFEADRFIAISYVGSTFHQSTMVIPFRQTSGNIFPVDITLSFSLTPIDTISPGSILGIVPELSEEVITETTVRLLDFDFNELMDDIEEDGSTTAPINDVFSSGTNINFNLTANGELQFILVRNNVTRSRTVAWNLENNEQHSYGTTKATIAALPATHAERERYLCDVDFSSQISLNGQDILWQGFIDGTYTVASGAITGYGV